jgi:hypothetical protein
MTVVILLTVDPIQVMKQCQTIDRYRTIVKLLLFVLDEKLAIRNFLENESEASQFLDQSRRLFSDQKSHMKEAKKK